MLKSLAIASAILVLLAGIIGVFVFMNLMESTDRQAIFDIPRGDNLSSITARLDQQDLLPSDDFVFKAMALMTRDRGAIQAGQYRIEAGMTAMDLLALFRSGKVIHHKLTFPEGLQLTDWLAYLQQAPYLKLMTPQLERGELSQVLEVNGDLEGWLFPDTYHYIKDDVDVMILKRGYDRMSNVLSEEWNRRVPSPGIETPYDALILASIIEKETGIDADREKIGGVFLNRLARGMKLQSDPTVIYGLGETFDGDLKRKDLQTDTSYNTYVHRGLPPTPICSPGLASIRAALGGSSHDYLYFVAMGDGRSYFSRTLEEHNQAVNRYQKQQP